jgi:hypothetical protein
VPPDEFLLSLVDGSHLVLSAKDDVALQAVAFLAGAALLSPAPDLLPPGAHRLYAFNNDSITIAPDPPGAEEMINLEVPDQRCPFRRKFDENGTLVLEPITLTPFTPEQRLWLRLSRLSAAIGREVQSRGGVLLHSALAVRSPFPFMPGIIPEIENTEGAVLLAARSGMGKSTVSRRLQMPGVSV